MVAQLAKTLALLKRFAAGLWEGPGEGTAWPSTRRWVPFFVRAEDLRNELVSKGLDVTVAAQVVQRSIWKFQKAVVREIERRQAKAEDGRALRDESLGPDRDEIEEVPEDGDV